MSIVLSIISRPFFKEVVLCARNAGLVAREKELLQKLSTITRLCITSKGASEGDESACAKHFEKMKRPKYKIISANELYLLKRNGKLVSCNIVEVERD